MPQQTFFDFLRDRISGTGAGFTTDEALASFLPLARQVLAAHEAGSVAPMDGCAALRVEGLTIWFEEIGLREPRFNASTVLALQRPVSRAFEVVGESRQALDLDDGHEEIRNLEISRPGEAVVRPVYVSHWSTWEHEIDHHDPITDIFSLGMILASMACGLDLGDLADLETFARRRSNLFALNRDLHPVIAKAIYRMTELDRPRRPQDLAGLLDTLANYRERDVDLEFDLAGIEGFERQEAGERRRVILGKLRERLFEISRRNRLLHFRQTMQSVNLTYASVALSCDVRAIRADDILTWNPDLQRELASGKPISLNRHLRFEDALYLPGVLDRIGAEARRDQAEFGFAHLRLVVAFLRWADLKSSPPELYDSPLILLPVRLTRKKGVQDTYRLEALSSEAEVNPVLRHHFSQLYGIELPATLDLAKSDSVDALYDLLNEKVQDSEPGVTLKKVDRPRIELIHDHARRRQDQYQRRSRLAGRKVRTFGDLDYSYHAENFHPLGLRLFQSLVRPPPTRLESIMGVAAPPRSFATGVSDSRTSSRSEIDRRFYRLETGRAENPFAWEFDLCRVTLANLKYRKMSLVRDYAKLLEDRVESDPFDAVFSLAPRDVTRTDPADLPMDERFEVVPCDPTQASAIAVARSARSYIIQGPPGTGKSQTITNLIADFVARGRRVLFVCEKRAAIDVVYHRLRQRGLDQLSCLIHDSQADKRSFVQDLKRTYEAFLASEDEDVEGQRAQLLEALQHELRPLRRFDEAMTTRADEVGIPVRALVDRLVELRASLPELSELETESLPAYSGWNESRDRIERLSASVRELREDGIFARHPLSRLHSRVVQEERPLQFVMDRVEKVAAGRQRVVSVFEGDVKVSPPAWNSFPALQVLFDFLKRIRPLAERDLVALLDSRSEASRALAAAVEQWHERRLRVDEHSEATKAWKEKLSAQETRIALERARVLQEKKLPFLRPGWWSLRGALRRRYDFASHAIKPTWVQLLEALDLEHRAAESLEEHLERLRDRYGFDGEPGGFLEELDDLREVVREATDPRREMRDALMESESAARVVASILQIEATVADLRENLDGFLLEVDETPFDELGEILEGIRGTLGELGDFLICLGELAALSEPIQDVLRRLPLDVRQIEAAVADKSLREVYRSNRALGRFTSRTRDRHVERLEDVYRQLHEASARTVRDRVRRRFLAHAQMDSAPASQLSAEQREFEKSYKRGRRELEHEFGKSMRYKSIRDLAAGDSGRVVRDLKPVWLMSPLSVSDTLPLDGQAFDVVIFDEASQITLEEAVPSVFRAAQVIVVGDEMQLPPTNFFSARRADDDEQLLIEEGGEVYEYDLGGDSFLNQAARNLPSTLLGWHYRSRSESLISFCNAAFYAGRLLTVPDERLPSADREEIIATGAEDAPRNVERIHDRAISFHFVENGVYERRRNRAEADYIARTVRELLMDDRDLSIGIVAFSEAQQDEIDGRLERLAREDTKFRDRYEAELERERDGQYVGLLIKNLENIQGDERDIVILSVCYGPDARGKTRMHFGPINQRGGEKRLNVAFSRARHHMMIVTSMRSEAITNDYNDGARCLKNYLRYADLASRGELAAASRLLSDILLPTPAGAKARREEPRDAAVEGLSQALRLAGYVVDVGIGQSRFRCDLAVRGADDTRYRLGILVDTAARYEERDIIEREMLKPSLLRAFGWRVEYVLTKDWYDDPEGELKRLQKVLEEEASPEAESEPDLRSPSSEP